MTTLAPSEFANLIDYFSAKMWIHNFQEDSGRTGAGEDISTDLGDPVWKGEITLDQRLTHAQAADAQSLIELLDGVIGRFYMCDPRLPYPIRDKTGAVINAHSGTPKILDINAARNRIRIEDLPPDYWLSRGDRFAAEFGSDPVHHAYHRISTTIQASGLTDWIDIRPHLSVGLDVGDELVFKRPSPLWRLEANGFQPGTGQGQITPGGSLKIVQVL
jgi:hypothetical protein